MELLSFSSFPSFYCPLSLYLSKFNSHLISAKFRSCLRWIFLCLIIVLWKNYRTLESKNGLEVSFEFPLSIHLNDWDLNHSQSDTFVENWLNFFKPFSHLVIFFTLFHGCQMKKENNSSQDSPYLWCCTCYSAYYC